MLVVFPLKCEVVKYSQLESSAFKDSRGFESRDCPYILYLL